MKVLKIDEQPDGSAIMEVEMTEEEQHIFLEIGVIEAIKKGMKTHEDTFRTTVPE